VTYVLTGVDVPPMTWTERAEAIRTLIHNGFRFVDIPDPDYTRLGTWVRETHEATQLVTLEARS